MKIYTSAQPIPPGQLIRLGVPPDITPMHLGPTRPRLAHARAAVLMHCLAADGEDGVCYDPIILNEVPLENLWFVEDGAATPFQERWSDHLEFMNPGEVLINECSGQWQ